MRERVKGRVGVGLRTAYRAEPGGRGQGEGIVGRTTLNVRFCGYPGSLRWQQLKSGLLSTSFLSRFEFTMRRLFQPGEGPASEAADRERLE